MKLVVANHFKTGKIKLKIVTFVFAGLFENGPLNQRHLRIDDSYYNMLASLNTIKA